MLTTPLSQILAAIAMAFALVACQSATQVTLPDATGLVDQTPVAIDAATPRAVLEPTPPVAPPATTRPTATGQTGRDFIDQWFAGRPSRIEGNFATTDTTGYSSQTDTLSWSPEIDESIDLRVVDTYSYITIANTDQLMSWSSLVLRGRALSFSRPYFNSLDGSYWDTSLVGRNAGQDVASEILRDVLFEVDEVIGDATESIHEGDVVEFAVRAGQAVVTIADTLNADLDDHPLGPGTFVLSNTPEVDIVVGEPVVVFLDYVELDGLYVNDGTEFGYIYRLMPAHDLYFKWVVDGIEASNPRLREAMTVASLRAMASSDNFASAVGPPPDDEVHSQKPHP